MVGVEIVSIQYDIKVLIHISKGKETDKFGISYGFGTL
jgi:hypothetical protein